jgi:hypothetical protein
MPEMANAGEDHRHVAFIRSGDDFCGANGAARLDCASCAGIGVGDQAEILKPLITRSAAFSLSLGEYLAVADICEIIDTGAATVAELLEHIYTAVARKAGVQLAGDKSPNDLNFLRILIKIDGIHKAQKSFTLLEMCATSSAH